MGRKLISDSRLLSVRGSAMGQTHRHQFGGVTERDRHVTAFTEVSLSGQDGDHAWVLGAAIQHDQYDAEDVPVFDFTYTVPALFAQEEYAISSWLSVSGSARLDFHSEYGSHFNPRLSVLIRPGEWVMRASAGSGYFPPSPFVEETEAVGLSVLDPFPGLEVEKARSVMADVGRTLGPWEFNAAVFGSEIEDAIAVRSVSGGRLELFNSPDPVRTWGTEFLARFRDGLLFGTATYVYTRSRETDPEGTMRREVPLTPTHTVGVIGGWESEGQGRIGAEFYYTGRQTLDDNPYRSTSEPYVIVGVIDERRFGRVRVFVNAENILDTRHTQYDPLVRPSRSPEGRWITDVWAPLEGVAINGGVRIAF
ncbi:MAG TPA: TonB-dependent receptor [Gemmatimonadetes bacterium]|nr:TonB-dependent receptor [Gemmatimonadota bacterium]